MSVVVYVVNYISKEKYTRKACGNEVQNNPQKTHNAPKHFQYTLSVSSIKFRPTYITLDDYKKGLLEGNMQNISEAVKLDYEDLEEDGDEYSEFVIDE